MRAADASKVLEKALAGRGQAFTVADAAATAGLPLRDAEQGLHALVSEYRGHLRVTEQGELVYRFPNGFTKPWLVRSTFERAISAAGKALEGMLRFVVRAWITIVLVGYVAIFLALLIGFAFLRMSGSDSRRDDNRGVSFGIGPYILFRVIADALFWTFHPFSPVAYYSVHHDDDERSGWERRRLRAPEREREQSKGHAFYDKVNRFFFGPDEPPPDPREMERRILAEIRAQKGRIGLADVMRVTGLERDKADPLMARLMLDYDGTVEVSDEGGIVYRFPAVRKTVLGEGLDRRPPPVWVEPLRLGPLTGNDGGTNALIVVLNGFNLVMSAYAISANLTIDNIGRLMNGVPLEQLPPELPIALGVVPLVFSIFLFALPIGRALWRPVKARRIARENGRRALVHAVLEGLERGSVDEESLRRAYRNAAGQDPRPEELTKEVVALGGDVDIEAGAAIRYRFPELEAEAAALEAEREAAAEDEVKVGKVIFSSED